MKKDLIPSISAGFLIAIADFIYLNADNKYIAAFLFPLALITIIRTRSNLYTGKIGSAPISLYGLKYMSTILLGNIIGLCFLGLFYRPEYSVFVAAKLTQNYWLVFGEAIICGCLMYIAVSFTGENKNNFLLTILCVAGFIIGKCEHCIADIGYFIAAHSFTLKSFIFIAIVVLGNSIGGIFLDRLISWSNKNNEPLFS